MFGVAFWADKRALKGRSLVRNPYVYALSMAVYCTAWTYYGSVGKAAADGVSFLTVYLGPALMAPLWYILLHKIILISKSQRINSVADFISARYGKSVALGAIVTIALVLGIVPYIALQLKAIAATFEMLCEGTAWFDHTVFYHDAAFYVAIVLAIFTMMFGTRKLEPNEQHPGMVAAIAFESLVKLFAFVVVGVFVTFYLFDGPGDLFGRAMQKPEMQHLFQMPAQNALSPVSWVIHLLLSAVAVVLLPRQFHVAVVENTDVKHVSKAVWLFPLYLLIINIFVLPIAVGGMLKFEGSAVVPDMFVLSLPRAEGINWLTLLVFIGGVSAATSMIIVATIALSVMISNNLTVPLVLRSSRVVTEGGSPLAGKVIAIRRLGIATLLALAYLYCETIATRQTLVNMGLVSFAAVAQLAPAVIGGIFWKRANRAGATWGLVAGFAIWAYTLPFASLCEAGIFPQSIVTEGLFGIPLLKPYAFFGMYGLDPVAHGAFWSLFVNIAIYVGISLNTMPNALEHTQANIFVNIYKYQSGNESLWRGEASMEDLKLLLARFLGQDRSVKLLQAYAKRNGINLERTVNADPNLVNYSEKVLAGAVGSASARLLITSAVKEDPLNLQEVMDMLDETKQILNYTRELERKSRELESAYSELHEANERLQEMDQLKNDFITTVTHELRTPMTSIKSLSSILYENEKLPAEKRKEFLKIIITQSERLSRLINQVLDLEKMESGMATWRFSEIDLAAITREALKELEQLCVEKNVHLTADLPDDLPPINADKDRIIQVVVNLVANAIKFVEPNTGEIQVSLRYSEEQLHLTVRDNGIGMEPEAVPRIFDKFTQFNDYKTGRQGSGLGLSITQRIVLVHNGSIAVDSEPGKGSTFTATFPAIREPMPPSQAAFVLNEEDLEGGVTMSRE